jgi:hypothetical protein
MDHLGLSSLSSVHIVGNFGTHYTALIWLTIVTTVMYAGPATVSLFYLLIQDRSQAGALPIEKSSVSPSDEAEEKAA